MGEDDIAVLKQKLESQSCLAELIDGLVEDTRASVGLRLQHEVLGLVHFHLLQYTFYPGVDLARCSYYWAAHPLGMHLLLRSQGQFEKTINAATN